MIAYHIGLGRLQKYFEGPKDGVVVPFKATDYVKHMKTKARKRIAVIDSNFICAFLILNSLFYAVYFYVSLN